MSDVDDFIRSLESGNISSQPVKQRQPYDFSSFLSKTSVSSSKQPATQKTSSFISSSTKSAPSSDVDSFLASLENTEIQSSCKPSHTSLASVSFPNIYSSKSSQSDSTHLSSGKTVDTTSSSHSISSATSCNDAVFLKPGETQYCTDVILGSANAPRGINRLTTTPAACDKLRCTSCDFRVVGIPDRAWKKTTEYIDFRNANTKIEVLNSLTISRPGTVAYCCQCTWRSVRKTCSISEGVESYQDPFGGYGSGGLGDSKQLRWVCGGHKLSKI
ncbi:putative Retinal Maintenance [Monocercomonoides exilis]|uniref:putative Retinal Maintenance n=1 Tax=Monocercomonoides exilis TaxID=2049356 RepID=UPI00355961C1|nr:putative Retinal Maintenance [Monocercomonoides exilis]|eukprot:MONOS_10202.1-p1 / transcript=MONOS_10202.1 / gene=MONOS_10202 / organism=Monocercomonoides_exilis_PA203 / gene_product=unspecified product / transcript_product=unspecified product / location=Mono_scaffold00453:48597-49489(-) / protein_length=272 / sequence_SO=supercontig / SO=protein_coding / is_pseudo=false